MLAKDMRVGVQYRTTYNGRIKTFVARYTSNAFYVCSEKGELDFQSQFGLHLHVEVNPVSDDTYDGKCPACKKLATPHHHPDNPELVDVTMLCGCGWAGSWKAFLRIP